MEGFRVYEDLKVRELGVSQNQAYLFPGPYSKSYNMLGTMLASPSLWVCACGVWVLGILVWGTDFGVAV